MVSLQELEDLVYAFRQSLHLFTLSHHLLVLDVHLLLKQLN